MPLIVVETDEAELPETAPAPKKNTNGTGSSTSQYARKTILIPPAKKNKTLSVGVEPDDDEEEDDEEVEEAEDIDDTDADEDWEVSARKEAKKLETVVVPKRGRPSRQQTEEKKKAEESTSTSKRSNQTGEFLRNFSFTTAIQTQSCFL